MTPRKCGEEKRKNGKAQERAAGSHLKKITFEEMKKITFEDFAKLYRNFTDFPDNSSTYRKSEQNLWTFLCLRAKII